MNNYDPVVLGSLDIAQSEALKRNNPQLHPEHVCYGLMMNPKAYSHKFLKKYEKQIKKALDELPASSRSLNIEQLRPSPLFSQWLTQASSHAIQAGRKEIAEPDLLRFMPKILPNLDINYEDLNKNMEDYQEEEVPNFLLNLNELAEQGKLDPVIGRNKEIRAVMEILGRRGKNNPVLVGSAGVGKTAIVEGLADLIVKGKVPDVLRGKTIYSLEMGSLMAGTKYRGDFEERIQKLLKFIKGRAGDAVLFIDEVHLLIGAGKTEGAMDAANLLKPALARGELHCIGATTQDEYQKYILNDAALARRFRAVPVNSPTIGDAIEILMGIKEKFEIHHGIKISDEAIYSAVVLSEQYITDKNLPDKAIDLIDEAASALKLSAEAMPAHLVELESEIRNKMILAQVEKNNKEILEQIDKLKKTFQEEKEQWEKEVLSLKKVSEVKNQLERLKFELEVAERKQNYEEASKIKYSMIPAIERELENYSHSWILKRDQVAQVISRQTGIPLEKILQSKQDYVLGLETYLKQRVFGQEQALHEIAETLVAAHAGLTDETKPLGSFLLLGPTGVGKTETVKAVAKYLFNEEKNIVRLDMSEFSERHSVAKLIGAPAGYVGYEEGGVLTEAIRRRPYSVILFDEIEKAHPDFSDILLQILDDGRLTDNKGRTIDFKNTIIFMTSNSKDYRRDFKPEVLGRIDEILHFKQLDRSIMKELVAKQIRLLNERLKPKKIVVSLLPELEEVLSLRGFSEDFGARPLESVFHKIVIRPLSHKLIQEHLENAQIQLGWQQDQLAIEVKPFHD